MPNLRFGSARTAPVVPEARLRRDAGASLPPLGSGAVLLFNAS